MTVDLTTTNVLLGILATVSLLEVLAVVGLFAGGFIMFRRLTKLIEAIEERQLAPAATRLNGILDDVKAMTDVGRRTAERAERMADWWKTFRGA
jgi:pyrimidine operon attenuation protein/uracil phosphoribosyltransferase